MARGEKKSAPGKRSPSRHAETILDALRGLGRPASAYDIQAALAGTNQLAPPTIYRALDRLIENGSVHKVESLSAFVACTHGCRHGPTVFAICETCGSVSEMKEPSVEAAVDGWSQGIGFAVKSASIELHGVCSRCRSEALQ